MDTHDVSTEYGELLHKQKQILLDARSRAGQRPPPRKPRVETIFQFKLQLMSKQVALERESDRVYVASSFAPSPYAPCVRPLCDLTKIMIDDLLLETHHRGRYLLVRAVTPQDRMTALMAIVEDEHGDVLLLQLYHQEDEKRGEAEDVVVEGLVMIIKEPYLKTTSDGGYALRVDHLSDVVFLPADDDRVPICWKQQSTEKEGNALAWKTRGNDHFAKGNFRAAIEFYTRALACSPTEEEARIIRLNRSLAFIKRKQFDAALSDVESATVTTTSTPAEKALFRKAQALYALQKFRECCEVLKVLRLEYPNNTAAKDQLGQAIKRLADQTHGKYHFKELHAEAAKLRPPHLDHAAYTGPVEVRSSASRGRGLFTTKPVKAGDLLLCEKAFAHAFIDIQGKERGSADLTILLDAEANTAVMGTHPELINRVIQKLYRNPSLAPIITDLHHGSYETVGTSQVDETPVVDTFLIRKIVSLNSFGCPLSTLSSHLAKRNLSTSQTPSLEDKEDAFHSSGIWPTASYINHSCLSNVRRSFIGDMMIVRATRDLPADAELFFWYQVPDATSGYRRCQEKLKHWGFVCDCELCGDEKEAGERTVRKRKQMRDEFQGLMRVLERRASTAVIAKAEVVLADVVATYDKQPARDVPRIAVWDMQLALSQACWQHGQPAKAAELALGSLASLGFEIEGGSPAGAGTSTVVVKKWGLMVDGVLDCWMVLREAYRLLAPGMAAPAEEYAKIAYRICFGEDETFEETYGNLVLAAGEAP